ncbi:DUF222 domain-containing protein [Microbacterium sp. bgisy189]|uniref:HNH endonuclease signature motif containing protein n=1 Tax=Microbacterium sp. bgisy189 TaxID=3413798 RepID=UPI003EB79BD5
MSSNGVIGFSDGETAVLAEIVAEIEKTQAILTEVLSRQTRALAAAGDLARKQAAGSPQAVRDHDMALRGIAAEVAGVLRVTDRTVQARIGQALDLVEQFPVTMIAWEQGTITQGHVRVIAETGAIIPPGERAAFETHAVQRAVDDTPGRIRDELRLLAERLHPRTLQERHVDAREARRVCVTPIGDGMSEVTSIVPSVLADGIYDRLTQQARAVKDAAKHPQLVDAFGRTRAHTDGAGTTDTDTDTGDADLRLGPDTRTMDQLRADVFTDLLLTGAPGADPTRTDDGPGVLGALRGRVQILVPALTLLGDDRAPADLVGHAPIDPATARELATVMEGPWERVITHPVTGAVLHCDTYHRTAAIDRFLRARDRHCRFPGCRQPAVRCEQDHTIDHAHDGPTEVCNLEHLCQRHHSMKQFTAWKVRQHGGGILEWTSPLGRVYIDKPPVLGVHFTPETNHPPRPRSPDDPPPF